MHATHAFNTDKPIAGLLADLKQRGLLEDTLVWWGGEFGRTPYAQSNGTGRDHNPDGFSVFLAGGGVKPGFSYGATDISMIDPEGITAAWLRSLQDRMFVPFVSGGVATLGHRLTALIPSGY